MKLDRIDRMAAKLTNGEERIYASGDITEGTTEKFLAFVHQHNVEAATVSFNSPGGSLVEGMKLGHAIRALEFSTTVGGFQPKYDPTVNPKTICASACVYAFAGGTGRYIDQYTGRLGVHQFYSNDDAGVSGETAQQVSGLVVAYLDQMGVDAKAFTLSTFANRDGVIWLSPSESLELRFANNGVELPTAEIKLANMTPYLKLEQNKASATIRILFNCYKKQVHFVFGIVTDPTTSGMIGENQKRSYLELDNKEFLAVPGKTGARANQSVVWLERSMTPSTLLQVLEADSVGGWVDGFGAVRYGGTLDMPTVRAKAAEFAKQCYGL